MNETIGVKGGKRDRKRRMIITKKEKQKLKNYQKELDKYELERLEKRVKQLQRATFVKTVPIAIAGQVITTIYDTSSEKKKVDKEEELSKLNLKERSLYIEKEEKENTKPSNNIFQQILLNSPLKDQIIIYPTIKNEEKKQQVEIIEKEQNEIIMPTTTIGIANHNQEPIYQNSETLELLKNRKIIDEYEKKLKEIRYDLRNLIFEYNVAVKDSEELYESKKATELLENLSVIIKKIEDLKNKLKIDDLDKYDDNYIYTLIENYIEEFKNKNFVGEIKDSELYILISEKLEELDTKKIDLNKKVETRKEYLKGKEIDFDKLKEEYYNYDKFNKELMKFQEEQDNLLEEIRKKIATAESIEEKVETQVEGLTRQSRRLLALLGLQMMLPGLRGAKGLATLTATYLYFMNNILHPNIVTKKYKVIKVEDYSREIESSIDAIDDVGRLLKRTSKQIDKMIKKFKEDYKEFIDVIPECNKLLANLEKVKEEIKERDYEVEKIKKEQQINLAKNNEKIKKIGKYEM